ncbi:MAG: Bifunctional protein: zinc-containing alcohol dehydrogenase; quinone oxidoreductase (NADPH:quinone reductase); Similar to arginate lyase [uncultured Chloroflexi bacterium]|uniref:Bifunctional protein: zinc-containing alcohol dehydrogenase quinone oxidoreductase ( NADPH:quinone reductase) Similar to arginate lyase n=1 Tax=uncultured Chloroflexota bacterium TaxID=166587 RepID=A0A6J4JSG3_9CHLR|nr:MAG: Bifunctional protein: zinc-containing alcohol dehydrogenase; quinone oxidoreductase (NADPH:quinone reductase); Similar to arginate lyase [uncultured Chloroflexota bacterium]
MRAMVATSYGPPEVLQLREWAKPVPKANEVLVRVRTTTVSAGDSRMRSFTVPAFVWLPARLHLGLRRLRNPILGMELAGDVEAVGKDVRRFKAGDRLFASTLQHTFGANAEYKCLPENGALAAMPPNVSYEEAAGLAIGASTALHFLRAADVRPGQRVLVNGASGAVGTFAVQIARHYGAHVTGVCSTGNVDLVKSLGADEVIDYTREDPAASAATRGATFDVVFDAVGKTSLSRWLGTLAPQGRFLNVGLPGDALTRRWYAATTGRHVVGGTASPGREDFDHLAELRAAGRLRTVIDRRYPLEQLVEAHRYVDGGHKRGSVAISVA